MKDFYYILGTSADASANEIEAAYQKLARKFYDEEDEFMGAHFREITEAYDILRDARRRKRYDSALRRNQRKQLAVFRLKYLNTAVTITFVAVTALFAVYVIRAIRGREAKIKQTVAPPPAVQVLPVLHANKHRKTIAATRRPQRDITRQLSDVQALHHDVSADSYNQAAVAHSAMDSSFIATLHANITGIVYLHRSADYNSAVLAKIPDGAEVRVLQKESAYYKISYNGLEGYVLKNSVSTH
ncbi:MAG: DnaJ domain-containing protein [Bacteroidetes bacterium]|nr:DnaJ domain-containing protein [Bacteroidota bacterium]